jgi:iron complex outermembrane recepter protein
MKNIRRKRLPAALVQARKAAICVAVGVFLSGAVHAQTTDGNIVGQAKAGATITLTSPDTGVTREIKAQPNGSFTFSRLPPGRYRVVTEGVSREVTVVGGSDARVVLDVSPQHAETVTVTGSRIVRDTFNSVSPVQIITREETTLAGFNSTTSVLQSTAVTAGGPQINNSFGGFVVDGGPGVNTVSLRGLGTSRTLVLLNGRRVSPAGSRGSVGSADLNVLPTAIIDHIEILKDGASSIYGSDAVAGVINIITRKNITGVTIEGQYNTTEHGGGDEQRYSVTAGHTFDRGYISGSAELYRRSELTWGDRDWMKCQTDYRRRVAADGTVGDWGSLDFIDPLTGKPKCYGITGTGNNGVTINTIGTGTLTGVGAAGSIGTSFNRWRPNSGISTGLVGFEGVGGGNPPNNINVRDTFDPRMMNQSLISPAELKTGFLQGAYDLKALGNAEVYGEALVHKRESHQVGYRQLSLDYARGSPLIPAGLANVPNVQAAPTLITNGLPLQVRAFIGFGNYTSAQDVDYDKGMAGIRGNLPFSDWKYDGSVTYAKSKASYMFEQWLTDRLAQSLDVVAGANGRFVCRNPANGCVAAPVISSQVIGGVLPQDWRDWTFVPDTGHTTYKESTAVLNTTGSLFQLPHGRVKGALGMEYRHAEIDDTPSLNMQTGNVYNFSSAAITRGKDSVWEVYGELEVPVLAGINFAEELTVNVSGRYTDYKSYGGDNTYKAGFLYTPVKAVSLRGSHGTSYRAPALFEQFLGSTSGFIANTSDPCHDLQSQVQTSIRARNCLSEGLPGNFLSTTSVQVNTIGGAGAGLKAETSKNTTVGIVLQPDLPVGMGSVSLAVDYYKITVENGVDRVGATNILSLCYNDPNFANRTGYCRLITRAPAGTNRALSVDNSYINVSTDRVRGLDFTLRVSKDIGPGNLLVNAVVTKYLEQSNKLFADDPFIDSNGRLTVPKLTGSLDAKYKWKEWTLRYGMDYVGKMSDYDFFGEDPATSTYKMDTGEYILHHLSLQYKADTWAVTGGVRNLTDKEPPQISQGFTNRVGNAPLYSGFDYFGRTFFVNVTKSF